MRKRFKWLGLILAGLIAIFWVLTRPQGLGPGKLAENRSNAENGALVFHAAGCASCHGPGLGGGLEMETAFGTFRAPNISPDPETGIGGWSTLEFVNAMAYGVSPGGRHYYPAFPYSSYTRMTIGDIIDLKAYIDTLEPVDNRVADHEIGFPWNVRRGIALWKRLYLDSGPVVAVAQADSVFERGRYLVESMGHCAECHTPRDRFGGLDASRWLAGAASLEGEGSVPNITPHEDGLASWSEADIAYYLESGFLPDFDMVGGAMVEVQENLAHLPDSDRAAIAAYLKRVPPLPGASE